MTTTPDTASSRAEATIEDLEQEGDVAADFLEGLLDIADIDGDLALDVRNGRAYVSIEQDGGEGAADLGALADPTTVQALQELTRIAVQNRTGRFSRLILDIGGSRDTRQRELDALRRPPVDAALQRVVGARHQPQQPRAAQVAPQPAANGVP